MDNSQEERTPNREGLLTDINWSEKVYLADSRGLDGVCFSESIQEDLEVFGSIKWDEERGEMGVSIPEGLILGSQLTMISNFLTDQRDAVDLLTYVAQRANHHPSSKGLVAQSLSLPEKEIMSNLFYSTTSWRDETAASVNFEILESIPESEKGQFGWFSPEANRYEFGTYYMNPTLKDSPNQPLGWDRSKFVAWELRQVGRRDVIDSGDWNDVEKLDEMFDICLEANLEDELIVASLLDSESLAKDAENHRVAKMMKEARIAFRPKFRIKPTLTKDALAKYSASPYSSSEALNDKDPAAQKFYETVVNEIKMTVFWATSPLFGFDSNDLNLETKQVHTALRLTFQKDYNFRRGTTPPPASVFDPIIESIQKTLSDKSLGDLLRVGLEDGSTELWVVKNHELAAKYADAIASSESERLSTLSSMFRVRRVGTVELYQDGVWESLEVGH